jgi:type IV pilus assembly protein PilB
MESNVNKAKNSNGIFDKTDLVTVGVLALEDGFPPFDQSIDGAVFADNISVVKRPYTDANAIDCEIVIVAIFRKQDIDQLKHDLALLKLVKKIPELLVFADEQLKPCIDENSAELSCDDIYYVPMSQSHFDKIIKTHAAKVIIERQRDSGRVDASRTALSLGQILVKENIINALELKKALDYQKSTGGRLGDTLVELGYIDEEQKTQFLASQLGVALATPKQYAGANLSVVSLIPDRIAKIHHCIALEKEEGTLVVAMTDVLNLQLLDNLRDVTDLQIKPILGTIDEIDTSIKRYYQDITSHKDASEIMAGLDNNLEYIVEKQEEINLEEIEAAGAELGIVKFVNILITNAIRDRASDIHLEPMEKELIVRYRVDGNMRKVMSPSKRSHQAIIARIKILSNLNIAERRLPQDGRMGVKMGLREVDVRVSILPTIFGEKAVLRILDKEAFEKSVSNLGFSPSNQEIFKSQITKPYGMVIVTGPTGSGKSTTLYSALQSTKSVTRNVITVEDPVEFHMDGINQVNVNTKIGLTFSSALRSILRQDPDVILIGEIRDDETADIAIKMALTGHLVFSTLHTNDAASSIARFIDIGVPPLLLGSSLNLIIAQRLVRRICPKCKVTYEPAPELLTHLNLTQKQAPHFFRGEGCVVCNGAGYMGRIGIFEMLVVSRTIRKMILKNASTIEIQEQAIQEGMKTLRAAGVEMAIEGVTTIEEIIAATTEI